MTTREQLEALQIDEYVFELAEDTELECLVHFAATFTGGDKCLVPIKTAPHHHPSAIQKNLPAFVLPDCSEQALSNNWDLKVVHNLLFYKL